MAGGVRCLFIAPVEKLSLEPPLVQPRWGGRGGGVGGEGGGGVLSRRVRESKERMGKKDS